MNSLNNKLNELDEKIALYNIKNNKSINIKNNKFYSFKIAMNCGLEIISGIIVGLIIGFSLDKFFNVNFFYLIFIIVGFLSGILNLYRYIKTIKDI